MSKVVELVVYWRSVLNRTVVSRVKHFVYVCFLLAIIAGSFQYQVAAGAAVRDHKICVARVDSRDDLRAVLFKVVDLSDVVPNHKGDSYTANRVDFINAKYPAISVSECD